MSGKHTKVYVGNGYTISINSILDADEAKGRARKRLIATIERAQEQLAMEDRWRVTHWNRNKEYEAS